jgi:acyl-CoA thioester hydrolase
MVSTSLLTINLTKIPGKHVPLMSSPHPQEPSVYHHQITVQPQDIDAMGHVNNVVYVRWVQEAAEAHWNAKAPETVRKKYNWVVLRHEVDYLRPALSGQTIIATTWVENFNGVRSDRVVQLTHQETGTLLAKAKTTWCLLDAQTARPKRIEDDITKVFGNLP